MRGSRRFNKRVQIWQTKRVKGEFGGNKVYLELITNSWAEIKTHKDTRRDTEVGVSDYSEKLDIVLRYRKDIAYNSVNQFLMYRGVKYVFTMSPNDMDFSSTYVTLTASREKTKSVSILDPINPTADTIFINYKNRVISDGGTFESDQCVLDYINKVL